LSEEYRRGLEAAAQLLKDTAADYEEIADRLRDQRAALPPKVYALQSSEVNTLLRDARLAAEKAALLRGQAGRIIAEFAP